MVAEMLEHCKESRIDEAYKIIQHFWNLGYAPEDLVGIIFRVCKTAKLAEYIKLEFIRVMINKHTNAKYKIWSL